MQLIIGGSFQGKSAYVAHCRPSAIIADGRVCTQEEILHCDIFDHLHAYIRRLLAQSVPEQEIKAQIDRLCRQNPAMCIVCNELGSGVVPMEVFDRRYRETVGRVCCSIAKQAKTVTRIICGIPTVLK